VALTVCASHAQETGQDTPNPLHALLQDVALVRGLQWLSNAEEKPPMEETADENEKERLRVWMMVLLG
jgi:hypothetical protein